MKKKKSIGKVIVGLLWIIMCSSALVSLIYIKRGGGSLTLYNPFITSNFWLYYFLLFNIIGIFLGLGIILHIEGIRKFLYVCLVWLVLNSIFVEFRYFKIFSTDYLARFFGHLTTLIIFLTINIFVFRKGSSNEEHPESY